MKNQLSFIKIRNAAQQLSQKTEKERNVFLQNLSEILKRNKTAILEDNKKDLEEGRKKNLSEAFIERLKLDENGIEKLCAKINDLQNLNSGIGAVLEERQLKNGISLRKISVPLGVILVIYEARPEVTIDVAVLCIKSGNTAILKGGSEALHTNKVLYGYIVKALKKSQIASNTVSFIEDRNYTNELLEKNLDIDLVIARGGYEMVKNIMNKSKIPVLAHSAGGARIYVDKSADLSQAIDILINSKISKPAACNSLDTILIHKDISDSFVTKLIKSLGGSKVTVLGDEYISKMAGVKKNTDWNTEFLSLTVAIKRIENVSEAIQFINKHTKRHSEGIIAKDNDIVCQFTNGIDAAALFVNCSTRFHDGYEFGLGSEMGIATGKLHARGPVGLKELAIYRWEAYGNGQIR